MNESIKRAKITLKKYHEGDVGADAVTCEYARYYGETDLGTLNAFLKVEFPDGTKNKFAMVKTVADDKVKAERVADASLTRCAGNLRAQLVLESAQGDVIINGAIFSLVISESVADETNEYEVIPSAVGDLQRQLQEDINEVEGLISDLSADVAAIESFMAGSFVTTVNGREGSVTLTKADAGLGNADNTSDLNKPLSLAAVAALSEKVDKVAGKGLTDENFTAAEKTKLAALHNYDDSAVIAALSGKADAGETEIALSGKVDKVAGKGLSTNDFTAAEKEKLAALHNYDDASVVAALSDKADAVSVNFALSGKVDKVAGKGLSDENFSSAEKTKLAALENYDDSAVIAALDDKADKIGTYDDLKVGLSSCAEDLKNHENAAVEAIYTRRTTGADKDVGTGVAVVKKIKGNTVVFNQLLKNGDFADGSSFWYARNTERTSVSVTDGVLTHTILENMAYTASNAFRYALQQSMVKPAVAGHKYIFSGEILSPVAVDFVCEVGGVVTANKFKPKANEWTRFYKAMTAVEAYSAILFYPCGAALTSGTQIKYKNLEFFDLTLMFGAGKEPSADVFKALYPASYYAYNAGEIINFTGTAIKTIGFNAFDRTSGQAKLYGGNAYEIIGSYSGLSYIAEDGGTEIVAPDANGVFTPEKDGTLTVAGGGADTCVHLVWSGYRNGENESYAENTLSLPVYTVEDGSGQPLFPDGLRSAGAVFDEITSEKAVKRVGVRDYEEGDEANAAVVTDYTHTNYPLITPVEVAFSEELKLAYPVDDFGSEEIVSGGATAPARLTVVYALNAVDKVRRLPENYISKKSFDNFVAALSDAMSGIGFSLSVSGEYDSAVEEYSFTVAIADERGE